MVSSVAGADGFGAPGLRQVAPNLVSRLSNAVSHASHFPLRLRLREHLPSITQIAAVVAGPVFVGALFGRAPIPFSISFAILLAGLAAFVWVHRERPLIVLVAMTLWLTVERFALAAISMQLTPTTLAALLAYNELFFPLLLVVSAPRIPRVFASSPPAIRVIDLVVVAFAAYVVISFVLSSAELLDRLTYVRRLTVLPMIYAAARLQRVDGVMLRRYVGFLIAVGVLLAIFGLLERFWLEDLIWRDLIPTLHFYQMHQATGVTTSTSPEAGFNGLPLTYWVFDAGVPVRRLVSTSIEATTVAMFFAVCTVVAMATRRWTEVRVGATVLLGVATFLTLGKGGIGVLLMGATYLVAIHWLWARHPGWITVAGFGTMLGLVGAGVLLQAWGATSLISTGAFLHLEGLIEGIVVASSSLFGLGVGGGGGFATVRTGAESAFGTMLVQLGWPGLLLWSGWLLGATFACAALSPHIAENRLLGFAIAAALAGFFATAALTESAGGLSGNWPYPLLAGLLVTAAVSRANASRARAGRS